MKVRFATSSDVSLIYSSIPRKSESDRDIGAFFGVLQTSEEKINKTYFVITPFA